MIATILTPSTWSLPVFLTTLSILVLIGGGGAWLIAHTAVNFLNETWKD